MSKLFYDKHLDLTEVDREVKKIVKDPEAREEIYHLIDEIVHHRVVGCILGKLPHEHHQEFVSHMADHPHDESILDYLQRRIPEDVGEFVRQELHLLSGELLVMIHEVTAEDKK